METVKTFCRVCEPSCGLEAKVEAGKILSLGPDKEHPVSKGFVCHKGIHSLEIHNDPDRLNYPSKKTQTGFERISWQQSFTEIAEKIKAIQKQYGSDAFGAYIGNPMGFNVLAGPAMASFLMQLGCRKNFNAGTQDCSNKFAGSEAVFGTSTLHPLPDIEHTDFCLIIGTNPKVSHMSFISIANPMEKIKAAKKRGAKFAYVNPRRIESVEDGDTLYQLKPDTDVYLLAAILHEIYANNLFKTEIINAHGKNIEELISFIKQYSPESVAELVGISSSDIKKLALDFASANSACACMSVGGNMGRQGTLVYWLMHMLVFVTGNLDKEGGNLYSLGFYPATKAGRINTEQSPFFKSSFGEMRSVRGALPGNLLADMIEEKQNPIRVLFVIGGNPLLSIGGSKKLEKALQKLDLIVSIDLYRNATAEFAHYALPATDMLERSDLNMIGLGMQYQPHVQYTRALVKPQHERKEEWWILAKLEQALGFPSMLDENDSVSEEKLFQRTEKMLSSSGISLQQVKEAKSHTLVLPPMEAGHFYTKHIQTDDKKVDCYPNLLKESIHTCHQIFQELIKEDNSQFKLINLRNPYTHNSWFQNVEKLRNKSKNNALYIHPDDAKNLALTENDEVQIKNQYGSIKANIAFDKRLRKQVVAMSHGWGNQNSSTMKVAAKFSGVNVNELLPSGPGSYEKISNQAHMTGISVSLQKL